MSLTTFLTAPVVSEARTPIAAFSPNPSFGVVGSVVRLDGRLSSDLNQLPLSYTWRFVSVPIGSQVQSEGFRSLDTDSSTGSSSLVSFSPDAVGEYVIGLVVSNDVFSSSEVVSTISIRAILVPHGRGVIPDGKFIWTYIRDIWSQVDGKEFFETLWSALIQITGTELLKLYQVDFNKSIRDIQDKFQRRWLAFEPKLLLSQDDLSFYIGNHVTGTDASTLNLGLEGQAIILSSTEVVVVLGARLQNVSGESFTILYSEDPSNIGTFELLGLNAGRNGYRLSSPDLDPTADTVGTDVRWIFTAGSVNWALRDVSPLPLAETLSQWAPLEDSLLGIFDHPFGPAAAVKVGDIIHYPSGPNAGFYRIVTHSGNYVTVDHAPPSSSDGGPPPAVSSNVYRPVGFKVTQPAVTTTNSFFVPYTPGTNDISVLAPGRIVVVGGQAFTIVRSVVDTNQAIPVVVVTVDSPGLLAGVRSLNWRAPSTIVSETQNFEELGLSTGDLLAFDIVISDSGATSEVIGQVIGVHGNAMGFVFTNEQVSVGEVPGIPNDTIVKLATDFGIDGVTVGQDGVISYSSTALAYVTSLNSGIFKRSYWNKELNPSSDIQVNPLFKIKPKYVIRNRLLPVDEELRSVPALQEWITQPTVSEKDGKIYQTVRGKDYELSHRPVVLTENLEYLIDDEFAFVGQMTINTGSNEVEADDADFLDRGLSPGDEFIIDAPLTLADTYVIEQVLSNSKVRLTKEVPAYVLGTYATANITLKRKKTGHFLRFVPGLFTAANPAPARLWAEVAFFDNNQTVEDNFGLLVGLKKDTLESVSRDINYRQAVSGLMFAFTRGSALDKIRLGAQILLGLPFAEHRGIIRSIEDDYRIGINGEPILGRLLVEDVDAMGVEQGTLRIYTYPIDEASALAGVDVNPATGELYVVGDVVELFAPLSKGVEIIDYVSNPLDANFSAIAQLQKYHSVRLRANDNIFSLAELDLVSDFLKKITPSYVAYSLITASEFADTVDIQDLIFQKFNLENALVDNASLSIAPTLMLNSKSADFRNQITIEDGVHSVRRIGTDLTTTNGSANVSSASGGFIDPKAHEDFEAPLVLVGDLCIISDGVNQGTHSIGAVVSDTELTLSDAPALGFETATGLTFTIVRRIPSPFVSGNATVTSGDATVALTTPTVVQLRTRGVAPGDWLILTNGGVARRHLIKVVKESTAGVWNQVEVTPLPAYTGVATYSIFRPALLVPGSFEVTSVGTPKLTTSANPELRALVSAGDELILDTPAQDRVTVLDPLSMHVVPSPPAGTYDVTIAFRNKASTVIGFDHIEKYDPIDAVEISLIESQSLANCTSAVDVVTLEVERTTAPTSGPFTWDPAVAGVMPGDLLVLGGGSNGAVDLGYGAGVYPIVGVSSSDVTLSSAPVATELNSWKIVRRR